MITSIQIYPLQSKGFPIVTQTDPHAIGYYCKQKEPWQKAITVLATTLPEFKIPVFEVSTFQEYPALELPDPDTIANNAYLGIQIQLFTLFEQLASFVKDGPTAYSIVIPIYTNLTTMSADDPKENVIGFSTFCQIGMYATPETEDSLQVNTISNSNPFPVQVLPALQNPPDLNESSDARERFAFQLTQLWDTVFPSWIPQPVTL